MLRTMILSNDAEMTVRLKNVLREAGADFVVSAPEHDGTELERMLRFHVPHLVLIDRNDLWYCAMAASHIEHMMPGVKVVAAGRDCGCEDVAAVMASGIGEFLGMPFEPSSVRACLERVRRSLQYQHGLTGGHYRHLRRTGARLRVS